jgi:hypothetical protein
VTVRRLAAERDVRLPLLLVVVPHLLLLPGEGLSLLLRILLLLGWKGEREMVMVTGLVPVTGSWC